jgi:hypothetical protein
MNKRKLWFGGVEAGRLRKIHSEKLANRVPGTEDAPSFHLVPK